MSGTMTPQSAARRWLANHDPKDGGGHIGHTSADQLFARAVVLSAYEAGAEANARLKFDAGFAACWAEMFVQSNQNPLFDFTTRIMDRGWFIHLANLDGPEMFEPEGQADDDAVLPTELATLISRATPHDLDDGGRYFGETYRDLTACKHSETGEYHHRADGELVQWLWNHRRAILLALVVQNASAATVAQTIVRNVAELPDRTSPDDQPEMLMVTADELTALITQALQPEA